MDNELNPGTKNTQVTVRDIGLSFSSGEEKILVFLSSMIFSPSGLMQSYDFITFLAFLGYSLHFHPDQKKNISDFLLIT